MSLFFSDFFLRPGSIWLLLLWLDGHPDEGAAGGWGLGAAAAGRPSGMQVVGRDEPLDKKGVAKAGGYK